MKLSQSERQTLVGPASVGILVGLFGAAGAVAFNSEYGGAALSGWAATGEAMFSFLAGFLLAFVPFGLAPVLIARFNARTQNRSE